MTEQEFLDNVRVMFFVFRRWSGTFGLEVNMKNPTSVTEAKEKFQNFYNAVIKNYKNNVQANWQEVENVVQKFYNKADSYIRSNTKGDCQDMYDAFENVIMTIEKDAFGPIEESNYYKQLKQAERYNEKDCMYRMVPFFGQLATEAEHLISGIHTRIPGAADFNSMRKGVIQIYKEVAPRAGVEMDRGAFDEFEKQVNIYYNSNPKINNCEEIENSFSKLVDIVSKVIEKAQREIEQATNSENDCLEYMNRKLNALSEEFKEIYADYIYKEATDFKHVRSELDKIYKAACFKNAQKMDKKIVKKFHKTLEDYESGDVELETVRISFDVEYDEALKTTKSVVKSQNKRSDIRVKRIFEAIFEKKVLPLFEIDDEDKLYLKFKNMYRHFKTVKKTHPKWYTFMESICSKNKIKKENFDKKVLMGVLLSSCCAVDDMNVADAICRGLRKITKNSYIGKSNDFIGDAEKARQSIKSKINSSKDFNDIKELEGTISTEIKKYKFFENMDNNFLESVIFQLAEKAPKNKEYLTLRKLFSMKD